MYRVQYKSSNASQAWATMGNYGSEQQALGTANRISGKYFMVRVVAPNGSTVWSG